MDFIHGHAAFKNSREIIVDGTQTLRIPKDAKLVLATGSTSMKVDVPGAELSQTCEEIFSSDQQPGDTVIVGSGRESENSLNGFI